MSPSVPSPDEPLPQARVDAIPLVIIAAIMLGAFIAIGSSSTWLTLSIAGLAMGLLIFIMASGLTLVFGLMDVMNFAHGLFIAIGAYIAATVMKLLSTAAGADSFATNLGALAPALVAAVAMAALTGLVFERVIIRPVYGQHLKQILITTGGMIVAEQLMLPVTPTVAVRLSEPAELLQVRV